MNKTAVITGATSGIGAEFARQLAEKGYDLIITGRREEVIGELAEKLKSRFKIKVDIILTELSEEAGVKKLIEHIQGIDNLELLINNAGFGLNKFFSRSDIEWQVKMNHVHTDASIRLIYAVLPQMIRQKKGYIINVASVAGLCPVVRDVVYCGSKAFLINFSRALDMEVKGQGVHIQALCPGFTRTDFHGKLNLSKADYKKIDKMKWMTADGVVSYSLKHLYGNKVVCIPGFMNRMVVRAAPFIPRALYYKMVAG